MAETNILPAPEALQPGCQSSHFDNQETIDISKPAASANVVRLRPTTILTTRRRSARDKRAYLTEALRSR